jgi:hypothetical protein
MIKPENPKTKTVVKITWFDKTIRIYFPEKRDDLRRFVKNCGYSWHYPYWEKTINKLSEPLNDRIIEIAHVLLSNGFCIDIQDDSLIKNILKGEFEPECNKWVLVRSKGKYSGWFYLRWHGEPNFYHKAMRIRGSVYDPAIKTVCVSPENYEEIEDFATINGFKFDKAAKELVEKIKSDLENSIIFSIPIIEEKIRSQNNEIKIADEFIDEPI